MLRYQNRSLKIKTIVFFVVQNSVLLSLLKLLFNLQFISYAV